MLDLLLYILQPVLTVNGLFMVKIPQELANMSPPADNPDATVDEDTSLLARTKSAPPAKVTQLVGFRGASD